MQLLRDNLTLWTSDMQGEGDTETKGEGGNHLDLIRGRFIMTLSLADASKEKVEDVEAPGES